MDTRAQAAAYFPPEAYAALEGELLAYGEAVLGCRAISPVWLSFYVDGCSQELHCDSFHGPFAFVLSLTHWEGREFTGARRSGPCALRRDTRPPAVRLCPAAPAPAPARRP